MTAAARLPSRAECRKAARIFALRITVGVIGPHRGRQQLIGSSTSDVGFSCDRDARALGAHRRRSLGKGRDGFRRRDADNLKAVRQQYTPRPRAPIGQMPDGCGNATISGYVLQPAWPMTIQRGQPAKLVKPKPISANDLRTTAVSARSVSVALVPNHIAMRCDERSLMTPPLIGWDAGVTS